MFGFFLILSVTFKYLEQIASTRAMRWEQIKKEIFEALKLMVEKNKGNCIYINTIKLMPYLRFVGNGVNQHVFRILFHEVMKRLELPTFSNKRYTYYVLCRDNPIYEVIKSGDYKQFSKIVGD